MAEQLAFLAENPDVEDCDEDDDASPLVGSPDAYVVELGPVAQG